MKRYDRYKTVGGVSESLDPTRVFKHVINMTRAEIAEDVSNVLNRDVFANDSRLTDDFCEKWIKVDLSFVKEMTDRDIRQKKMEYMYSMLEGADFDVPDEAKTPDLLPDDVSTEDV